MATVQGFIGAFRALETAGFGYLGSSPAVYLNLLSATVIDPKTLMLSFDHPPAGAVLAPGAYTITPPVGAAAISIRSVSLGLAAPGSVYPVTVYLKFVAPGTAAALYSISLASSIEGVGGEALADNTATWTATAYPVEIPTARVVTDPLKFMADPSAQIIAYEMMMPDPFGPTTDIRHLAMLTFGTDRRVSPEELPSDQRDQQFPDRRGWLVDPDFGTRLWAYRNAPLSTTWDWRIKGVLTEDLVWWLEKKIVGTLDIIVDHDSRGRYIQLVGTYPNGEPFDLAIDQLWRLRA